MIFTDLPGRAVVLGVAHAVAQNAGAAVAGLKRLTMRVFTALGAVFHVAMLAVLAVFILAAVWVFGLLTRACR